MARKWQLLFPYPLPIKSLAFHRVWSSKAPVEQKRPGVTVSGPVLPGALVANRVANPELYGKKSFRA